MAEFEAAMGDEGNGDDFGSKEGGDAIEMDDTEEMMPMAEKWGMKLAGCYQTAAGEADSNEVLSIWTAGDMIAAWGAIRDAAQKDPALKRWEAKAGAWRHDVTYKFLLGLVSFSPLRMKEEFLQAVQLMKAK